MRYSVEITRRAELDVDEIVTWIAKHSPQGANVWLDRLLQVVDQLSITANKCSLAPENGYGDTEIRHLTFKTRRGKPYRLLFTIRDDVVLIRHVRGPGQDLVPPQDFGAPRG